MGGRSRRDRPSVGRAQVGEGLLRAFARAFGQSFIVAGLHQREGR